MQQSDGTENDKTGRGMGVEVCRATVVYQPLNLTLNRHVLSASVQYVSMFLKGSLRRCEVRGSRQQQEKCMLALKDDDVRVMLMSTLCCVNGTDEPQLGQCH